jgi:hypothetical protein
MIPQTMQFKPRDQNVPEVEALKEMNRFERPLLAHQPTF